MTPTPELQRLRSQHYQQGRAYLDENPIAGPLMARLTKDCPHLETRDLIALFHLGNDELVQAAAHRLEYNATHPSKPPETKRHS